MTDKTNDNTPKREFGCSQRINRSKFEAKKIKYTETKLMEPGLQL